MSLFDETFKDASWRGEDDFPSTPEWKKEIEKYLNFLKQHSQYERFKERLNKENKGRRDKTFAEIKVAYFIVEKCGFKLKRWEPEGNEGKLLEFEIQDKAGTSILCEVKCPGWEREIIAELNPGSKMIQKRIEQGKLKENVRSCSTSKDIREIIKHPKTYPKFLNNRPSLLIFMDDLFTSPMDWPNQIEIALFSKKIEGHEQEENYLSKDGYFLTKEFENLGGILFLKVTNSNGSIHYDSQLAINPKALPKCKIPDSAKDLSTLPVIEKGPFK